MRTPLFVGLTIILTNCKNEDGTTIIKAGKISISHYILFSNELTISEIHQERFGSILLAG